MWIYNGTGSERARGNTEGVLLASAARTSSTQTANQTNYNARGVLLTLQISVAPAAPPAGSGLIPRILVQNELGVQTAYTPEISRISAEGVYSYLVYPGAKDAAGTNQHIRAAWGLALPRTWFGYVSHGDAEAYTYSLTYAYVL